MVIRVFLSHSTKDDAFARDLGELLQTGGEIKTWADHHDIEPASSLFRGLRRDWRWTLFWRCSRQTRSRRVGGPGVEGGACGGDFGCASVVPAVQGSELAGRGGSVRCYQEPAGYFRRIKAWLTGLKLHGPAPFHAPARPPMFVGARRNWRNWRNCGSGWQRKARLFPCRVFRGSGRRHWRSSLRIVKGQISSRCIGCGASLGIWRRWLGSWSLIMQAWGGSADSCGCCTRHLHGIENARGD